MKSGFVIAIDGPVAAGKGTIAPLLAEKIHGFYLYTGAMYRCVAFFCAEHDIDVSHTDEVISVAKNIANDIDLSEHDVLLKGKNVTESLKESDIARTSSIVAAIPEVRACMVDRQQAIAREKIYNGYIVIAEGRDTGTKVFPDAALKIFLTASPEVRAQRRIDQYAAQGESVTYEQVLQDTIERDRRDTERSIDPLPKEPEKLGYTIINDSTVSPEVTLEMVLHEIKKKNLLT